MKTLNTSTVEKTFSKKIYFAHQSLGGNILHGISLLAPERSTQVVTIQENSIMQDFGPGIYHSRVGSNSDLKSKIDEFSETVASTFNGELDIAFVKLCYLDIVASSDIDSLFSYYKENLAALKKSYPNIDFIHFTVPLMIANSTWKTQIKKLIGKDYIWEYADNIKRNQYNQMLIDEYMGKEPIFDLAMIESIRSDGTRESFTFKGQTYYALVSDYSRDGAHLNDLGSKKVGASLLGFLAEINR